MEPMTVLMVLMKMSAVSYLPCYKLSPLLECPPSDFQCQTPCRLECIDNRLVCDGAYDCSDGSDENECSKLSLAVRLLLMRKSRLQKTSTS